MNTTQVYEGIINALKVASENISNEPEIVKTAIDEINKINLPGNIKRQTGFCHQKPYALFVDPKEINQYKRTELGDLMFVVKFINRGECIDYRTLFFQAKYDKDFKKFKIEKHQQRFYSEIEKIDFKFGNKVYSDGNIEPIIWKHLTSAENFGDYFLIGSGRALDVGLTCINSQYDPSGNQFSFDIRQHYHIAPRHFSFGWEFQRPLLSFLSPYGKGNKVEGLLKIFTELIYKKLGMIADPPEEHQGYWEEDPSGFGVVEFTFVEE